MTGLDTTFTLFEMERVRGTCVAVHGSGVLLRGDSAAGKSDLALRLIDAGAQLVADDYTCVDAASGRLMATAPEELRGLLEVRGIGIVSVSTTSPIHLVAIIDLVPSHCVERMPEPVAIDVLGISVPVFRLDPFEASITAKVRLVARIATRRIVLLP